MLLTSLDFESLGFGVVWALDRDMSDGRKVHMPSFRKLAGFCALRAAPSLVVLQHSSLVSTGHRLSF